MAVKSHSGALTKKIILKAPVKVTNNQGGIERAYSTGTIETRADVKFLDEFRSSHIGVAFGKTIEVIIRNRNSTDSVKADWLLEWEGKEYVIHTFVRDVQFIRIIAKGRHDG